MSGIPADPFGRSRLPATFDRAGRVQLVHECASALLRGELPGIEARLFLASGFESRRGIGARRQSIGSDGRIVGRAAEIGRKPAPILDDRLTLSPPDTLFTRPSPYTKPLIIKDL